MDQYASLIIAINDSVSAAAEAGLSFEEIRDLLNNALLNVLAQEQADLIAAAESFLIDAS